MKTIKTLILILGFCYGANAQYNTSFSAYSDLNFSKGVEIRGEFEDWYIGFQAENYIQDKEYFFNWGFSVGVLKQYENFDMLGGGRVGFITVNNTKKPLFGIETEIDYKISDNFFIGVRGSYDMYFDSPNIETPTSKKVLRGFIKAGYKF